MIPLCVLALVVVNVVTLGKLNDQHVQLNSQREAITKTRTELKTTSESLKRVEGEKTTIDASLKQEHEKTQGLEQENQSLKVNLQAKREAQAAQTVAQTKQVTQKKQTVAVAASGTCADWLAAAGVTDVANAQELIRRESGCNPHAVNPSSGACGVAQELPCGKSGCSLGDGACQIAWMRRYVNGRYGGWAGAIAFHNANNWY